MIISNTLIIMYGNSWFLYATALGAAWNGTTDFFGQKFWTYQTAVPKRPRVLREVLPYALLRLTIAAFGFSLLSSLFFVFELPYSVSSIATTLMLWLVSYKVTRVFFTGSSRGMPTWFRYGWIGTRKWVRS